MGPEINAREMDEAENLHCHTGAFHQLDGAAVYSVTTESILKKMHFHTVTRAFRKSFSESVRDFAFFEQEIFECNCPLRRTNRLQHCRKMWSPFSSGVILFPSRRGGPSKCPMVRTNVSSPTA